MKTNRSLLCLILLSIVTLGIYALFFWSHFARDMNIVCHGDGKHTRGIFGRILLNIVTLGIYEWVWLYGAGERIFEGNFKRGLSCGTNGDSVLLWYVLGSLCIVGPFIALYKLIRGLNELCIDYNSAAS